MHFNKKTRKAWDGIKRRIRLCMTGARATSDGDGPRWADWGDRVGGLKGVAWGPIMKSGVSDPSYRRNRIQNRFFVSGSQLKKTFGEAFGAATGVGAPSYRRRRNLAH